MQLLDVAKNIIGWTSMTSQAIGPVYAPNTQNLSDNRTISAPMGVLYSECLYDLLGNPISSSNSALINLDTINKVGGIHQLG